jgi:regulator of replication initiation timing
MTWLLELFDGVDLPDELVEKLRSLESQFEILESQNVVLKLENEKLKAQADAQERESKKTKTFPNQDTLNDVKTTILRIIARSEHCRFEHIEDALKGIHETQGEGPILTARLRHYLDELDAQQYIRHERGQNTYALNRWGRKYLEDNQLWPSSDTVTESGKRDSLEQPRNVVSQNERIAEAVEGQLEIMRLALEPRLRIAEVKAEGFEIGQIPVFILSLLNDGATDARDVAIHLSSQIGDKNPSGVRRNREQIITIPAHAMERVFVRWTGALTQEQIDQVNNGTPLQVSGYFKQTNTEPVPFCYKYHPWTGERPDGVPQFVPCDFDPTLDIFVTIPPAHLSVSTQATTVIVGQAALPKTSEPDEEAKPSNVGDQHEAGRNLQAKD